MEMLALILLPIKFLAFNPVATGVIALLFSVPCVLTYHSPPAKWLLGICAAFWWLFTYIEATTSIQTNIRVDLVLLGPVYLLTAIVGVIALFKRKWKKTGAAQSASVEKVLRDLPGVQLLMGLLINRVIMFLLRLQIISNKSKVEGLARRIALSYCHELALLTVSD